jgi:prepilin-type processing-associated H-X9-DG protein
MTKTLTLSTADLWQFTGSEHWYRHSLNRNVLFTDGAKYVADTAGAYWLLDEIALIQPYDKRVAAEKFQVWKLVVHPDQRATLTCEDGNVNTVFTKQLDYTDFPLDEITLYFTNNVIYLPSEY